MRRSTVTALIIVVLLLAVGLVVYQISRGGTGTVAIGVTDAPLGTVSHIYLTVSGIELQREGNSTASYYAGSASFDLLSLVNVTKMLGSTSIPAGNYTMIRFEVASAVATIAGANVTLNVPSGQEKVPVHFRVESGKTTTIVLDITVDMTNVSASGNLRPVVTVKSLVGPS